MNKEEKEEVGTSGISRREFLKDASLVVGGATIGSIAVLNACGGDGETVTKTVTSTVTKTAATVTVTASSDGASAAAGTVKLTVNGRMVELKVTPVDTLRDALREQLGLTSIKDMCCGYGACGSCSVIMDGRPVLSCMALAIECGGSTIETAEGIAKSKPELIEAYSVNHCMQCGYCTPGFVVTAKALLDHKANPTVDEIRQAISGNLCRCATYPLHIRAVQAVS
jgi:aerobic-type carbon monoxide dehydrogenase small subunit (CoxS/CutS family)